MSEQAQVLRRGALDMQVCVPRDWTDEQVKDYADTAIMPGTTNGWTIRRTGDEALDGDPERAPCDLHTYKVHITLDC